MNGEGCHGGIEMLVGEGQVLGNRVDRRAQMRRPLGSHRGGRLDSGDRAVDGLIGAGAGADVENRQRLAKCGVDGGGNAWLRLTVVHIALADRPVICVAGAAVGMSSSHIDSSISMRSGRSSPAL